MAQGSSATYRGDRTLDVNTTREGIHLGPPGDFYEDWEEALRRRPARKKKTERKEIGPVAAPQRQVQAPPKPEYEYVPWYVQHNDGGYTPWTGGGWGINSQPTAAGYRRVRIR